FVALAQWRVSKDSAVPWYLGYLVATFLHYGRQFWMDAAGLPGVPPVPDPPLEWGTPLSYAAFAGYFLFVRQMLATRLSVLLGALARFLGAMSAGHLLVQAVLGHAAADAAHQVAQVALLPVLVWLGVDTLRQARLFYQKLVLAGTAALVLGFLCVVALRRSPDDYVLLPDMLCCFPTRWGDLCLYHLKVGVLLDVLCFSWALALRQRVLLQAALLPPQAGNTRPQSAAETAVEREGEPPDQPARDEPPPETEPAAEPALPEAPALEIRPRAPDALLERLNVYLAIHCENEELKIGQIAKDLSISTTQLNRRLRHATGRTTEQYLLHYRLERAYGLLQTTNYPVSEVAVVVGLPNMPYFSKAFRRRYGCSPREVRNAKT
ncbi:MAG: helix-turn-helix domain-containing protein, partial [Saprospiraceae bacterium]